MENYLSKSNCLVYLIFQIQILLVENQIEKILIKIESKFKVQYIKSQLKLKELMIMSL
jgi:hypothetical protein